MSIMDEHHIERFIDSIINVADLARCQRISARLRDRLLSMGNDDYTRDIALMIGEAATFCDEAQSMLNTALEEIGDGVAKSKLEVKNAG